MTIVDFSSGGQVAAGMACFTEGAPTVPGMAETVFAPGHCLTILGAKFAVSRPGTETKSNKQEGQDCDKTVPLAESSIIDGAISRGLVRSRVQHTMEYSTLT